MVASLSDAGAREELRAAWFPHFRACIKSGSLRAPGTDAAMTPHWEHFPHEADMGVRGFGATKAEAFEQAALAMTAVIPDLAAVTPRDAVRIECGAPDDELLLAEWLNSLIYEMATRKMLFSRFTVRLEGTWLTADPARRAQGRRVAGADGGGRLNVDLNLLERRSDYEWEIPRRGAMRVPAVIYASEALMRDMDHKVYEQAVNVATLPGIVKASYVMPDAHWGYGFPIGGVAAFNPEEGGVVSAGGVGFDISCGVRCMHTGLKRTNIMQVQKELAEMLYYRIPAGLGSTGTIHLDADG
ncbi:MAG: archease, partial [Betaproteobacteria bacterium]|nr:archease [Betaproteobacteria bacterium]